jgi:hypothetical protein
LDSCRKNELWVWWTVLHFTVFFGM